MSTLNFGKEVRVGVGKDCTLVVHRSKYISLLF